MGDHQIGLVTGGSAGRGKPIAHRARSVDFRADSAPWFAGPLDSPEYWRGGLVQLQGTLSEELSVIWVGDR
jgi:hypothetical protein